MTATITISRSSIISDIRLKSHMEAASISAAEERYIVEAGTEKVEELNQCVTDAFAEVSGIVRPVISAAAQLTANDNYRSSGDLVLSFDLSERKSGGFAAPLADAIHKYVVDSAMSRFYRSVARPVFADSHERMLIPGRANIEAIIYVKNEPTY